jgi:glycosyltransferase involved in cell wall biosynthesis
METIYPIMDVFVLSSKTEGTSIALLEAQACGIPSVVTNVGGNKDIIKNEYNGYLVDLDNPIEMSLAIQKALKIETYNIMSKKARERIKRKYSIERMMNDYIAIYNL